MEVEQQNSEKKDDINIKYADNTGKKPETAKRRTGPRRKILRFRGSLGRRNYLGKRTTPSRRKDNKYSKNGRRQRGYRYRPRGVKILVRNLTRNATNLDIKYLFERIGPLKRCGINWNELGESKGTAEVEYLYRKDAFKAVKELDYKSIRGVPIRLEIREGERRILFNRNRNRSSTGGRRFRNRSRNYDRNKSDSGRRRFSRRNDDRRGSRRRDSRSERRYRKY